MSTIVFIGDELTAAGFRLTGIDTVVPSLESIHDAFAQARRRAELVLLTAEYARYLPSGELEDALLAEAPIIAIIPDIRSRVEPPDLVGRMRAVLGIEG